MFRSIASRLIFWFLLIALVPCIAVALVINDISSFAIHDLVERNLRLLAEGKADDLESYADERLRDASNLAQNPAIIEAADVMAQNLKKPMKEAELRTKKEYFLANLRSYAEINGYPNIYLFGSEGEPLLALKHGLDVGSSVLAGPMKDTELGGLIDRARTLLQPELSDYQIYAGSEKPLAFSACPVLKDGAVAGVVAIELDNDQVFSRFENYMGLGQTGEFQVGSKVGDAAVIVAPLRHDRDAAFKRRFAIGDNKGLALQRAVQGQRGYGEVMDYRNIPCVAVWTYVPNFRWGLTAKQDQAEAFALISQQRRASAILLAITIVAVACAALFASRRISRPIVVAAGVAKNVASGDLTTEVMINDEGETGQLQMAIQTMVAYLRSLITKVQESSVSLLGTATELASTSRQQEQTMNEFGASTNQAAAAVKQISATGRELVKTMDEVTQVAQVAAEKATHGKSGLESMASAMHQLLEATTSIGSKLAVISERARGINLVVTTITKVADQTNLLSINAAIEAEKAGEAGLGFLVVAREIRRLADQTAIATLDIERMVQEMQQSVSAGVMEMDKFSEQVRLGVGVVHTISSQLTEIISSVELLTSRFEQVNDGMRAQSTGAEQIREAMIRLTDGASQTVRSLNEFNKAAAQMREAVSALKDDVSWFTVSRDGKLPSS